MAFWRCLWFKEGTDGGVHWFFHTAQLLYNLRCGSLYPVLCQHSSTQAAARASLPYEKNIAKMNNAARCGIKCHEVDCNSLLLNNLPKYAANLNLQRDN